MIRAKLVFQAVAKEQDAIIRRG